MGTKLLTPFLPILVLAAAPVTAQQSGTATSQIKIGRTVELNKDGSVKQVIPAKVEGGQKVEAPQDPQKPAVIDRIDEL
ncbi:MAG: hypothetical protein ACO3RU_04430, partial [Planctomycetota bacterium]